MSALTTDAGDAWTRYAQEQMGVSSIYVVDEYILILGNHRDLRWMVDGVSGFHYLDNSLTESGFYGAAVDDAARVYVFFRRSIYRSTGAFMSME